MFIGIWLVNHSHWCLQNFSDFNVNIQKEQEQTEPETNPKPQKAPSKRKSTASAPKLTPSKSSPELGSTSAFDQAKAIEAIGMLRATASVLRASAEQLLSNVDKFTGQIDQASFQSLDVIFFNVRTVQYRPIIKAPVQ